MASSASERVLPWDARVVYVPRCETPATDFKVWDELRSFVSEFEGVWRGGWSRDGNTVEMGHAYAPALCVPAARKSMEPLSARVNERADRVWQFIRRSPWSHESLQDRLIPVGAARGVFRRTGGLCVDDPGDPKKGRESVGVQAQYCGNTGKVDNCQVLPTLVYGEPARANRDSILWPLRMRLYLPREWASDAQRRRKVGVPEAAEFRTRGEIALAMIDEVRSRVPHGFIGGDSAYGKDGAFRAQLRAWTEPYVLAVPPTEIRCAPDVPPEASPPRGEGPPSGR